MTIQHFTIIGSGTLGARIGLQAALSGFEVILYDQDAAAFSRAKSAFGRLRQYLIRKERSTAEEFDEKVGKMIMTTDLDQACEHADLISESVIEDVSIKKSVWAAVGKRVSSTCVLTTNTSYLLPSMFANESGAPGRFCAFHFHDVFTARVVDIMPHQGTDPEIISTLMETGIRLNQIPVVIRRETPGYIFNKMFANILLTAGSMLADGISDIRDIDRSWMGNYGMPIGPFGMMDEVGLDTVYHVSKGVGMQGNVNFLEILKEKIARGELGIKAGKGFYSYPNPEFKEPSFLFSL